MDDISLDKQSAAGYWRECHRISNETVIALRKEIAELQEKTEREVRQRIVRDLRSSAFLHCDVNKEDVLLCILYGTTLIEAKMLEAKLKG